MFSWFRSTYSAPTELLTSSLYDDSTFYARFERDLKQCRHGVIIESPFVTGRRLSKLMPMLEKSMARNVRIVVNTRDPEEQNDISMRDEARRAIPRLHLHLLWCQNFLCSLRRFLTD